jgi:signal transduction histidine kinase
MRLRRGTADEAVAMVARAAEHIAAAGRERAFADFHDANGGFVDRDLYVFCFDRNGIYSAFGTRPDFVGRSVLEVAGIDRDFVTRAWAAASGSGGWVQYEVSHPLTGEISPKESYVRDLGDGQLIGCGIYRAAAAGAPRAAAWSRRQERQQELAAA